MIYYKLKLLGNWYLFINKHRFKNLIIILSLNCTNMKGSMLIISTLIFTYIWLDIVKHNYMFNYNYDSVYDVNNIVLILG